MRKIILLFSLFIISVSAIAEESSLLSVGSKAPLFSLPVVNGSREALSVWCGETLSKPYINDKKHKVIISFWATYCQPCKKEIPALHTFYEKHKDKNIKIFLISIDSKGNSIVAPHIQKENYTLPVLLDPYKRTSERYGVKSVPSLFVIGEDGKIIYSAKGFKEGEDFVSSLEQIVFGGSTTEVAAGDESVVKAQETQATDGKTTEPVKISSKQRWRAVAEVECGASPDSIATKLGVSKEELKKWYNDIKNSAIKMWGK